MQTLKWVRATDAQGKVREGVARLHVYDDGQFIDVVETTREHLWEATEDLRTMYPNMTWEDTGFISLHEHIEALIL